MRKSWYTASPAVSSVRVVTQPTSLGPSRRVHKRVAPSLGECLAYPLIDGPGVAILLFLPPVLLFQSLPTFDVISIIDPLNRGNWALGLLVLPIFTPMLVSFAMVLGYVLVFFGHMFVASALGEPDHPRWPEWDAHEITEGIGRWIWAGIFGAALGGLPIYVYWVYCGDIDWFDRVVIFDLVIVGSGYALMSLAASLLHETLAAANPLTVIRAITRIGWDYVLPSLTGGIFVLISGASLCGVMFLIGSFKLAMLALYGFWLFSLYAVMVVLRMVGLTYHAHAGGLLWFQGRPKWGTPARFGKLYSNS